MKRIWVIAFTVVLIFSMLAEFLLNHGQVHGEFPWSNIPGVFILLGFIACVAIVIISKLLGHHWLQRKEDYYNRKDDDE